MTLKELIQLLRESTEAEEVDARREEIAALIPKTSVMFGFDQKTEKQNHDLWMHSVHTALNLPKDTEDDMLFLAALLSDIGKPDTMEPVKNGKEGEMYWPGHELRSREIVKEEILPDLQAKGEAPDPEEQKRLLYYIEYHNDLPGRMKKYVRKHMKLGTFQQFLNLLNFQIADAHAQMAYNASRERAAICENILKRAENDDIVTLFTPAKWMI